MKLKLHDYQTRAISFGLENKQCFFALDAGLGKTAIMLNIIKRSKERFLVIAPLRVALYSWPAEIEKWTPDLSYIVIHGKDKIKNLAKGSDITLLPYSQIKFFYNYLVDHAGKKNLPVNINICFDESSFLKAAQTKRFKMLKQIVKELFKKMRFCLSATPAPESLFNLWSQYFLLDNSILGKSQNKFLSKYYNNVGRDYPILVMKTGADEQIQELIKPATFCLQAEDYLKMPDLIENKIYLQFKTKEKKLYDKLQKDYFLKINDKPIEAMNTAALSMKLRQFLQGCLYTDEDGNYEKINTTKLDALSEFIEGNAGNPVMVVVNFKFETKEIRKKFGQDTPALIGGVSSEETAGIIKAWNSRELPLLLVHPAAVSHGLNLQSGGSNILFYCQTWSSEQKYQLIRRLYRQGQQADKVIVHYLLVKDTIDDMVFNAVQKKQDVQQTLIDYLKEVKCQ